jgi:hypothetical protein
LGCAVIPILAGCWKFQVVGIKNSSNIECEHRNKLRSAIAAAILKTDRKKPKFQIKPKLENQLQNLVEMPLLNFAASFTGICTPTRARS